MKTTFVLFFLLIFQSDLNKSIFTFPQDHSVHEEKTTEWWYYTGHLHQNNRQFGYELTFFRVKAPSGDSPPIIFAHFAISDIQNLKFYHEERMYRPLGGVSGYKIQPFEIWVTDWKIIIERNKHYLYAKNKNIELNLELTENKPPIAHGNKGKSYKSDHNQDFSYYYSITNLKTKGQLRINNNSFPVSGTSWMDHEWMTLDSRDITVTNWDWFSIQLDNNTEIMFYIIKDKKKTIQNVSCGTIIFPNGNKEFLALKEVDIKVLKQWTSTNTQKTYPAQWKLEIPKYKAKLILKPFMNNQELYNNQFSKITYWEGAVSVSGTFKEKQVKGNAYIELTGY